MEEDAEAAKPAGVVGVVVAVTFDDDEDDDVKATACAD